MLCVFIDAKVKGVVLWMWMMQRLVAQIRVPTPENTWKLSTCVFQVRHPHLPTAVLMVVFQENWCSQCRIIFSTRKNLLYDFLMS